MTNKIINFEKSMMRDNNEELMIELYEKKNKQKLNFLGQVALNIKNYEFEKMYDLLEEIQPPPSCESGKYIVNGSIHYTFYKSFYPRVYNSLLSKKKRKKDEI
jgi:hypothetical protein